MGWPPLTGNAYLMNAIGPSATVANQLAIASISITGDPNASLNGIMVNLFSGLSLQAGTYYLVLSGNGTGNNGGWLIPNAPSTTVGAGVTNLGRYGWIVSKGPGVVAPSYASAGSFQGPVLSMPGVQINGTSEIVPPPPPPPPPTPTPEPATAVLIGSGMVAWALLRRK